MDETTPMGWQRAVLVCLLAAVFVLLLVLARMETKSGIANGEQQNVLPVAQSVAQPAALKAGQLTHTRKEGAPLWSPDGKMIAFNSTRQYHLPEISVWTDELWVMRADGTDQRVLLPHTHPELNAKATCVADKAWFPDGGSLLCKIQHPDHLLLRVYLNGNIDVLYKDQQLGPSSTPHLSPDGRWVAFDTYQDTIGGRLWLLDVQTKTCRVLKTGQIIKGLTWLPDSRHLLYARREKPGTNADLWKLAIDGGEPVRVSDTPELDENDPVCSPDGNALLFIADDQLYRSELVPFAPKKLCPARRGEWSPDGRLIKVMAVVQEERRMYTINRLFDRNGKAIPTPADLSIDSFAPDGSAYAGTRDHDIWVEEIGSAGDPAPPSTRTSAVQAGAPFRNLLLSIDCEETYAPGQPVTFTVHEKNVGKKEITLAFYRFPWDYQLTVLDAEGQSVEKAGEARKAEEFYAHPYPISRPVGLYRLQPGEEFKRTYDLRAYVTALPPGEYNLQVMRRSGIMGDSEDTRGGALSLPCRFTIQ